MRVEIQAVDGLHLSPPWEEGGVCLVPWSGATLALSPLAWEVLRFLQKESGVVLEILLAHIKSIATLSVEQESELESALNQTITIFERHGVVRLLAH